MRRAALFFALILLQALLFQSRPAVAAMPQGGIYRIVVARSSLGAGECLELRLVPPPPAGARVGFGVASGSCPHGLISRVYCAPYVIQPGASPVTVTAGISGVGLRTSVSTEIKLMPGRVPGTDDCLGPGQAFATGCGDLDPESMLVDELPAVIHSITPEFPKGVRLTGRAVIIKVLVCRNGRVLDAQALATVYRDPIDPPPAEHDPRAVDAAVAAARQFVFSPARVSGQPIAVWVHVPIRV